MFKLFILFLLIEKQKLREEEIASIVDKKLREYKEEKELNRKRTTLRDFF